MRNWLILITLLVVGALFVPAVSAEELYDSGENTCNFNVAPTAMTEVLNSFKIYRIQDYPALKFVYLKAGIVDATILNNAGSYSMPVTFTKSGSVIGHGSANYNGLKNAAGTYTDVQCWLDIDDWNIGALSGAQTITITPESGTLFNGVKPKTASYVSVSANQPIGFCQVSGYLSSGTHMARNKYEWRNTVDVNDEKVLLTRVIDSTAYHSTLLVTSDLGSITDASAANIDIPYLNEGTWTVTNSYGTVFTGQLGGTSGSAGTPVTVYIQNSQTGALINSVALGCKNYDTDEWTNSTIIGGWTSVSLPAGNYEFYAEAPGFTQTLPGRLTVDGVDDNIVLLLNPTGPTPEAGNVTLQVWCNYGALGDGNRYGVPGAEVSIIGLIGEGSGFSSGILTANEQGFITVEAPGNTTYSAYASKIGYISGETEFSVLTASPVHVSISLTPGAVPTEPPITPTVTPTPTKTPVPGGFMDDAGNGIAQLFGVSLAVGKMLLGFLIALAVGMGTAKQLEGGAPEFVVGFTGAAFLTTVAGLIPIGFFVLVAVLAGIYLGKSYIGGGEGDR